MRSSRFHFFRPACVLRATGPDATGFLQGQFSNDLGSGAKGESVYGLWLDRRGKIVADSFVLARSPEDYWIVSYYCEEAVIRRRLEDYLVMDEVELEGVTDRFSGWSVFGSAQEILLQKLGLGSPESGGHSEAEGVIAFWGRRGSEPSLELLVDSASESRLSCAERIEAALGEAKSEAMNEDAMERLAIEGRVPSIGRAFGSTDLPQDLGLVDTAISFNKGCFLGQEVMARLRSLGRVRKRLARVALPSAPALPSVPIELTDRNGKKQGELRSVAYSENGSSGLAVVSTSFEGDELAAGEVPVVILKDGKPGEISG